jgi:hypothetical protein
MSRRVEWRLACGEFWGGRSVLEAILKLEGVQDRAEGQAIIGGGRGGGSVEEAVLGVDGGGGGGIHDQ